MTLELSSQIYSMSMYPTQEMIKENRGEGRLLLSAFKNNMWKDKIILDYQTIKIKGTKRMVVDDRFLSFLVQQRQGEKTQ